jgi:nicotinate-nucleotide pyrophosphorylase (carboxylating)
MSAAPEILSLAPLPDIMLEPLVRGALREDLGRAGDITTDSIIPADLIWSAQLTARQPGIIAGLALARLAFHFIDPAVTFTAHLSDGTAVTPGAVLATVTGPARGIITGERVALNFLCHLSGVATATRQLVDAVRPHAAKICCTRKTTPGLRAVEKYAVRAGGGHNHRFGLDDAVLIKDNHIAAASGVAIAIHRARQAAGHLVKIELEVDTLDQLREALALPPPDKVDVVLLDNMSPALLKEAVKLVAGRCVTEASGRVNRDTVQAIAASGVDMISVGWITHSAPVLDIGLDEIT